MDNYRKFKSNESLSVEFQFPVSNTSELAMKVYPQYDLCIGIRFDAIVSRIRVIREEAREA